MSFSSVEDCISAVEDNFLGLASTYAIPLPTDGSEATQVIYGGPYKATVRWSSLRHSFQPSQMWTWGLTVTVLRSLQDHYIHTYGGGHHPIQAMAQRGDLIIYLDIVASPPTPWRFGADQMRAAGEYYPLDTLSTTAPAQVLREGYRWARSRRPSLLVPDLTDKTFVQDGICLRIIVGGDRFGLPSQYPRFDYGDVSTAIESIRAAFAGGPEGRKLWPSFEVSVSQRTSGGQGIWLQGAIVILSEGIELPVPLNSDAGAVSNETQAGGINGADIQSVLTAAAIAGNSSEVTS